MMRLTKYLFCVLSLFFVVGCSSLKINIAEFESMLDNKLDHMIKISENELTNIYGIDLAAFKEYTFKRSYTEPSNIYVLVLPSDSNRQAKKEVNKFFEYLEKYSSNTDKKRIKNRYVKSIDDYFVFLVTDNNKELYKEIKENLMKDN